MTPDRERILREMGLGPIWKLRAAPTAASAVAAPRPQAVAADPDVMVWNELAATTAACRRCKLCETRTQAVLGVGGINADWLFVGEAPGGEEDQRGEPFVGEAGQLLDNMLAAIGLKRGTDVYLTNAVKCRPAENHTPTHDEAAACRPYLQRQIELIQPKLIVALGRLAAQTLLHTEIKIADARGKLHEYRGIPLIVTYHPAYLLRSLLDKALAWEDLCLMKRTMKARKGG